MRKPEPNFFIVGAPKCGTTSLYEHLRPHPQIFMPYVKELHHFGSDLQFSTPLLQQRRDRDTYLSYFADWAGEPCIGEASVFYLASTRAAQEIHDFNPDARIIIMLRNPVDMLYSLYHQLCFTGVEDQPSFEDALAAEEPRKQGQDIPPRTNWVGTLYYREMATYSPQVQRYFDVFGREQVHVIILDDYKRDPEAAYAETLRFLQVDDSFRPDFAVANASKTIRNPLLRDFLNYPPEWYQALLRMGKQIVPTSMREWVNDRIRSYNAVPYKRPPMNPETRQRLTEDFAEEVSALGDLLGRDLSHWSQPRESQPS